MVLVWDTCYTLSAANVRRKENMPQANYCGYIFVCEKRLWWTSDSRQHDVAHFHRIYTSRERQRKLRRIKKSENISFQRRRRRRKNEYGRLHDWCCFPVVLCRVKTPFHSALSRSSSQKSKVFFLSNSAASCSPSSSSTLSWRRRRKRERDVCNHKARHRALLMVCSFWLGHVCGWVCVCAWLPFRYHESKPRCQVISRKSFHVCTNCCHWLRLFIAHCEHEHRASRMR